MQTSRETHQERLDELMERDQADPRDMDRRVLFFVISSMDKLYEDVEKIYDFEKHEIKTDRIQDYTWSSGERNMIRLAFNLFSAGGVEADIYSVFKSLDPQNVQLGIDAIKLRFAQIY